MDEFAGSPYDVEVGKIQSSNKNDLRDIFQISPSYKESTNSNLESNVDDSRVSASAEHNDKSERRHDVEITDSSKYYQETEKTKHFTNEGYIEHVTTKSNIKNNAERFEQLPPRNTSARTEECTNIDKVLDDVRRTVSSLNTLKITEYDIEKKVERHEQLRIRNTSPRTEEYANIDEIIKNDRRMVSSLPLLDVVKNGVSRINADKLDIGSNAQPEASFPTLTAIIKDESTIVKESAPGADADQGLEQLESDTNQSNEGLISNEGRNNTKSNLLDDEIATKSKELSELISLFNKIKVGGDIPSSNNDTEKKEVVIDLKARNGVFNIGSQNDTSDNSGKPWKQVRPLADFAADVQDTRYPVLDCSSEDSLLTASVDISNCSGIDRSERKHAFDKLRMDTEGGQSEVTPDERINEEGLTFVNGRYENNEPVSVHNLCNEGDIAKIEIAIENNCREVSSFPELDDICNKNGPANEGHVQEHISYNDTTKETNTFTASVIDNSKSESSLSMRIVNDKSKLKFKESEGMGATISTSCDESTISSDRNKTIMVTRIPTSSMPFRPSRGKQNMIDPSLPLSPKNSHRISRPSTRANIKKHPSVYDNESIPSSIYSSPSYKVPRAGQRLYLQGLEREKKKLLDRKKVMKDRQKSNKLELQTKSYVLKTRARAQSAPRERGNKPVYERRSYHSKRNMNVDRESGLNNNEADNSSMQSRSRSRSQSRRSQSRPRSMTPGRLREPRPMTPGSFKEPGHRLFDLAKKKKLIEEERKQKQIENETNYKPPKMRLATKRYMPIQVRARDDELRSIHERLYDLSKQKQDNESLEKLLGSSNSGRTRKQVSEDVAQGRVYRYYSRSIWKQKEGRERRENIEKKLAPRLTVPTKTISVKDGIGIYERGMRHKINMEKKRIEHATQPYCSPLLRNHTPIGKRSQTPAGTRSLIPISIWDMQRSQTPHSSMTLGRSRSTIGRSRSVTGRPRSITPNIRSKLRESPNMCDRSPAPIKKVRNEEFRTKLSRTPKIEGKSSPLEPGQFPAGTENKTPLSERGFPGSKLPMSARLHVHNMSQASKKFNEDVFEPDSELEFPSTNVSDLSNDCGSI